MIKINSKILLFSVGVVIIYISYLIFFDKRRDVKIPDINYMNNYFFDQKNRNKILSEMIKYSQDSNVFCYSFDDQKKLFKYNIKYIKYIPVCSYGNDSIIATLWNLGFLKENKISLLYGNDNNIQYFTTLNIKNMSIVIDKIENNYCYNSYIINILNNYGNKTWNCSNGTLFNQINVNEVKIVYTNNCK